MLASKLSIFEVNLLEDPERDSHMGADIRNIFVDQQKWYSFFFVEFLAKKFHNINMMSELLKKRNLYNLIRVSDTPSYDINTAEEAIIATTKALIENVPGEMKVPKIAITSYCSRKPGFYIWNAYFLIFLITLSPLTIFSMNCKQPQFRLNTSFTILLTSITFKW